ncbi:MAG: hypothetical protein WBE26_08635 [Phycisphaerae bacterium]
MIPASRNASASRGLQAARISAQAEACGSCVSAQAEACGSCVSAQAKACGSCVSAQAKACGSPEALPMLFRGVRHFVRSLGALAVVLFAPTLVMGQDQSEPSKIRTATVRERHDVATGHRESKPKKIRTATVRERHNTTTDQQQPSEPSKEDTTDERLGERLIRKAVTDSDEDTMAIIIRLMDEATRKLEIEFDAGDETQKLQRRIMLELDVAIKTAAAQRRPLRHSGQPTGADKRRMPTDGRRASREGVRGQEAGEDSSSSDTTDAGGALSKEEPAGGDLRESRRAWGHLPMREREEIIQGVGERYLERYRTWIERYYRALQETEE